RRVVIAFCQLTRGFAARRRHGPDGGVIAFLLVVDGDTHKRNARTIRRHLRITDPDKIPKVFLSDETLFGEGGRNGSDKKDKNDEWLRHVEPLNRDAREAFRS